MSVVDLGKVIGPQVQPVPRTTGRSRTERRKRGYRGTVSDQEDL